MTDGLDRRQANRRHTIDEHGIARARVRPGHDVTLVDVSAGGALIETERRLLPGSCVELVLVDGARSTNIRGRVLRCAVARLDPTFIRYRGAVGFERDLSWFLDRAGDGYQVPTPEMRGDPLEGAQATHVLI